MQIAKPQENPPQPIQVVCYHKEPPWSVNNIIAGGQLLLFCISLYWVYKQLQKLSAQVTAAQDQIKATRDQMYLTYEWNKRSKAFFALEKHKGNIEFSKKIHEIEDVTKKGLPAGGQLDRNQLFQTNRDYRTARLTILNDLESLAIEIKHDMCDEVIAYDLVRDIVVSQWDQMEAIILARRIRENKPKQFIELEILANKWKEKYNKERFNADAAWRTESKPGMA